MRFVAMRYKGSEGGGGITVGVDSGTASAGECSRELPSIPTFKPVRIKNKGSRNAEIIGGQITHLKNTRMAYGEAEVCRRN